MREVRALFSSPESLIPNPWGGRDGGGKHPAAGMRPWIICHITKGGVQNEHLRWQFVAEVTEGDLQQAVEAFGQVASVNVIKDKFSGVSRGFGFVEMPAKAEGQAAIDGPNGTQLKGQTLNVNEARPRREGRRGGGGGVVSAFSQRSV